MLCLEQSMVLRHYNDIDELPNIAEKILDMQRGQKICLVGMEKEEKREIRQTQIIQILAPDDRKWKMGITKC